MYTSKLVPIYVNICTVPIDISKDTRNISELIIAKYNTKYKIWKLKFMMLPGTGNVDQLVDDIPDGIACVSITSTFPR